MITPTSGVPLTSGYGDLEKAIKATVPGMAYFAGTGPDGRQCHWCGFWGGKKVRRNADGLLKPVLCRRAVAMGARANRGIPADTPACKYFVLRMNVPDMQGRPRAKKGSAK